MASGVLISALLDWGCMIIIRILVLKSESHISILAFYLSALSTGWSQSLIWRIRIACASNLDM